MEVTILGMEEKHMSLLFIETIRVIILWVMGMPKAHPHGQILGGTMD